VADVSFSELCMHAGDVVDRVVCGEHITIVRAGEAVAELRPIRSGSNSAEMLLRRWRRLPVLDPVALRRELNEILGS
jgi:antitoxin (DNA-binding transcriptional repressor) of toxin-antitoxin stability system